jgi:anthranilate synthase/aminodeoxychorismate synthase-like glutamine amidotransferase
MILLIDNYDSFTYNIFQFVEELGARCKVVRNDQVTLKDIEKMNPSGIILSPGPGNPDESGICLEILKQPNSTRPVLGVCLGHQAIGQVFGGRVVRAKTLMHGKVSQVHHDGRGIFEGLKNPLTVTRYHSLVVDSESVPESLELTATAEGGVVMGLRHGTLPIEGIQFHPESMMTECGKDMLANFLRRCGEIS